MSIAEILNHSGTSLRLRCLRPMLASAARPTSLANSVSLGSITGVSECGFVFLYA
jgi:hypothetical protein